MHITRDQWIRYNAANAQKRKKSATLRAIHAHITALRAERAARKVHPRAPAHLRLDAMRSQREIAARSDAAAKIRKAEAEQDAAIRATLLAAAREARKMGFEVRASTARDGRISSYYATRANRRPIRISDHQLPQTARREVMSEAHGGGSAFAAEIIITDRLTATRLRRLLRLAEASRI